jgi:hypothetical protein
LSDLPLRQISEGLTEKTTELEFRRAEIAVTQRLLAGLPLNDYLRRTALEERLARLVLKLHNFENGLPISSSTK